MLLAIAAVQSALVETSFADTPGTSHHTRILYTSYPHLDITGPDSKDAPTAHLAAINTKNAERFKPVWTYLLTETDQN